MGFSKQEVLEWGAIAFSGSCAKFHRLLRPWDFPSKRYWSGVPLPFLAHVLSFTQIKLTYKHALQITSAPSSFSSLLSIGLIEIEVFSSSSRKDSTQTSTS